MLPPVRAASSTFNDFQSAAPQAAASRPRVDVANSASRPQTATPPISALSGDRTGILSLSSQLQLSQSFSIFAETVGRILKLERREGEALPDYSKRILDAVKALNPTERAALEKTLNQLVKGISLKLLAELLKNPIGPDAARLAMRIETAQLSDRDPVTKAVVSSYRQNAAAESVSNAPLPPRPGTTGPISTPVAAQTAQSPAPGQIPTALDSGSVAAGMSAQIGEAPETLEKATVASASVREADPEQTGRADRAANQNRQAIEDALGSRASLSASLQSDDPDQPARVTSAPETQAMAEPDALEKDGALAKTSRATELSARPISASSRPTAAQASALSPSMTSSSAPVFYDAPALARRGQTAVEIEDAPRLQRHLTSDRAVLAAMKEWLVEILAGEGHPDGGLLPVDPALPKQAAPDARQSETAALRQLLSSPGDDVPTVVLPALPAATEDAADTTLIRPEVAGVAGAARGAIAAEPETIAVSTLAAQAQQGIQRDGVPLPYVPYEPAAELLEEEKPEEKRQAKDGDGEQQASGDDGSAQDQDGDAEGEDEQPAAGDAATSQDLLDQPDDDIEERGAANDLYWRMADLS